MDKKDEGVNWLHLGLAFLGGVAIGGVGGWVANDMSREAEAAPSATKPAGTK